MQLVGVVNLVFTRLKNFVFVSGKEHVFTYIRVQSILFLRVRNGGLGGLSDNFSLALLVLLTRRFPPGRLSWFRRTTLLFPRKLLPLLLLLNLFF